MSRLCAGETEYRELSQYPGYRVGSDGSVWSRRLRGQLKVMSETWRPLAGTIRVSTAGYLAVRLTDDSGKQKLLPIHTVVLTAFHGPRPNGKVARWRNEDREDNRASNLFWGDRTRNCGSARLSQEQVQEIRRARASGESAIAVAARYGIDRTHVYRICDGKAWDNVRDESEAPR